MGRYDDLVRETLSEWPEPPATRLERLEHTVDIWSEVPDEKIILIATSGIYGKNVQTGITMGDLREMTKLERLVSKPKPSTPGQRRDERLRKGQDQHSSQ